MLHPLQDIFDLELMKRPHNNDDRLPPLGHIRSGAHEKNHTRRHVASPPGHIRSGAHEKNQTTTTTCYLPQDLLDLELMTRTIQQRRHVASPPGHIRSGAHEKNHTTTTTCCLSSPRTYLIWSSWKEPYNNDDMLPPPGHIDLELMKRTIQQQQHVASPRTY